MEIIKLLEAFEEEVEQSSRIPITGKLLLDEDTILDYLDQIRASLPEEIRQAQWVIKERERVLKDAQSEAEKVIEDAQKYIEKKSNDNEIVRKAQEKAGKIVEEARKSALDMEVQANNYAQDMLKQLEGNLEKALDVVKSGREQLQKDDKDSEKLNNVS